MKTEVHAPRDLVLGLFCFVSSQVATLSGFSKIIQLIGKKNGKGIKLNLKNERRYEYFDFENINYSQ